jgi:hypothetical protein
MTSFRKLNRKMAILFTGFIAFSFSINAQTWPPAGMNGSGTSNSPWEITTAAHLIALADYVGESVNNANSTKGKCYKLMNDIDLNGLTWVPIGDYYYDFNDHYNVYRLFQGNFDGNGKTVKNITGSGTYQSGFFWSD